MNVPEKLCKARSKSPPSSSKEKDKTKEARSTETDKKSSEVEPCSSTEKDKKAREVDPRNNEKDIPGKGQRYYLYDQELKRPTENPNAFFRGGPRGFRGGRLPFHMHDYHGIYPTNEDVKFERELQARREREYRIYSRPPDTYHNTPRSPLRSERSERYDDDRRRSDYDSYSRRHSPPSSRRHWEDRDRDSYHHQRSGYSSSTRRRRHSYEEAGRSRTRSPESSKPKEKERDDFDLDIELHPLMHFIDDKPKLLKEALSILKGRKLDAMIPHIFSHLNPREVEEVCLQELNTLNIATIANVIDGKLVNAELANPTVKTRKSKGSGVSVKKIKKRLKEAITEDVPKKKKRRVGTDANPSKSKKLKKDKKHKKKRKKSKQLKADELPLGPGLPPQKTLMELLELEYRAKAIKALLKSQDINNLSSEIDDALILGDPEPSNVTPVEPPTVPTLPPAPPEINTRFLVDNTYIYPMQIKLELEDPLADDMEEGQFPPSPPVPAVAVEPMPVIVPGNTEVPADTCLVDPCPLDTSQGEPEPILLPVPSVSDSQVVDTEAIAPNDPEGSHSGQPEDSMSSRSLLSDSFVLQSQEALPVQVPLVTEPEVANPVDDLPPKPRISIVITLDDDDSDEDEVSDDDKCDSVSHKNIDGGDHDAVPCMNGQITDMETEPVELEESELEEGEFGDQEEEEQGNWREKAEIELEVEAEESEEAEEDELPLNTYVRRSSDLPVTTTAKDRDESPPRLSLVKVRPEVPAISRAFPEAEDISSDESSGLEPLEDDGIVIGGGDPVSDTDDPITILPPPVHSCQPMPEGYEPLESEHDSENSNQGDVQEEVEDEETNPRTWFNRWYNSKKVQKNVKSNKMIGKLRSKLRREKLIQEPLPPEPSEEAVPIIGSINEYKTLFSSGKYKVLPENEEPLASTTAEAVAPIEAEEEAEDDDALWGDIIG